MEAPMLYWHSYQHRGTAPMERLTASNNLIFKKGEMATNWPQQTLFVTLEQSVTCKVDWPKIPVSLV